MRESINYNMLPLPYDDSNDILMNVDSRHLLTNVSSNAYYGYQPQLHVQNKTVFSNHNKPHDTKDNSLGMEIQYNCFEKNCEMQIENDITRHATRKRRCCYDDVGEFKKRRQTHEFSLKSGMQKSLNYFR